jgi:cytochrome c biogenesis protein CcdA/thiol-disulfide isomerase/thioredoxin
MVVLLAFAFVAGAATALSPCVLPVLPVVLSAGATGGARRPLGVVAGLVLSFTFAIVALVYVIAALGLPDDLLRNVAVAVLGGFGIALVIRRLSARVEAELSRLARRGPVATRGDGFESGLVLGASLGLVYAPCAGPILAGVITVSAAQQFSAGRLAVASAYAVGAAAVLYALMLGGRRIMSRLLRRSRLVQPAIGALMICVAVVMAFQLDIRFEMSIADDLPAVLVNPAGRLESSGAAREPLAGLRGGSGGPARRGDGAHLPVLAEAPEIRGTQQWFNTPGGRPLALSSLRGRVVLIDFWTYSCINCIRTLPHLKAWDARYRGAGLTIIGVHSPEFPFERDPGNVARAIRSDGLRYPVVQDNELATWRAYDNQYWPAKYLIDARGRIRYAHFGEGDYEQTEAAIRALLEEAGDRDLAAYTRAHADQPLAIATPETYLGADRAERVLNGSLSVGTQRFKIWPVDRLPLHYIGFEGRWHIARSHAVAAGRGARLVLRFVARRVFLVLGSSGGPRRVDVFVDGRRQPPVRVTTHRLYGIVALRAAGTHRLTLEAEPGVKAYAFTFG